jgi:hypothetical protein
VRLLGLIQVGILMDDALGMLTTGLELTHAQLEYAKVKHQVIKEKRREIDTLNHVIKEFMGPFILIGYDLNNNPVEMISAESTAEHDAVLERLRRVMYKINQNIANSNGNDPYGFNNN